METINITTQNLRTRHNEFLDLWENIYKKDNSQYFQAYSKEEALLHIMLHCELYYIIDSHTLPQTIKYCNVLHPGTTEEEIMQVYEKYLPIVREIYG